MRNRIKVSIVPILARTSPPGEHPDPVYIDERIIPLRDAVASTESDIGGRPGLGTTLGHHETSHLALQSRRETRGGPHLNDFRGIDPRNSRPDFPLASPASRPGDDDLVESKGFLGQCEVPHHSLAGRHRDFRRLLTAPNPLGRARVRAGRHVQQQIASVLLRECADTRSGYEHLNGGDRRAGLRVRHSPGYLLGT